MNTRGNLELYIVLAVMALSFVFAVGAVIVFVRTWRREKGKPPNGQPRP